jgi:hypothetical protein
MLYQNTREFINAVQVHLNGSLNTLNSNTSCAFFGEQEILNMATEQLYGVLVPDIKAQNQDYFVVSEVFKIQGDTVDGFGMDNFGQFPFGSPLNTTFSRMLKRAIGSQVVSIQCLQEPPQQFGYEIQKISRDSLQKVSGPWWRSAGYTMENDKFVLFPKESFNGSHLKVYYFRRPNKLVIPEACAKVISKNTATNTLTFSTVVPSTFVPNIKVDVISGESSYGAIYDSLPATNIVGNTLTLPTVENISDGDWVCLEYQSPVVQIPQDFWTALIYLTVASIYQKYRYMTMVNAYTTQYQQILKHGVFTNTTPRTIDQQAPMINYDSPFNSVF